MMHIILKNDLDTRKGCHLVQQIKLNLTFMRDLKMKKFLFSHQNCGIK
jgi:hypothetical protein